MGRYVPPDLEGVVSFNRASGKTKPRTRTRDQSQLSPPAQTVRFELPFAVWCTHCVPEGLIGQGVRFNAEKRKVGMYFTTPVWEFRIKHTVCGGWIEIRTDPGASEYVVVGGGRRRDYGDLGERGGSGWVVDGEDVGLGEMEIGVGLDARGKEEEKDRLERDGGFGQLEKKVVDRRKLLSQAERLDQLKEQSEKGWSDPYERNRELRKGFRVGRRKRDEDRKTGEELGVKYGLNGALEILPGVEEDGVRAGLIEFGEGANGTEENKNAKPLFVKSAGREAITRNTEHSGKSKKEKKNKKSTAEELAGEKRQSLQDRLSGKWRLATDPFVDSEPWTPRVKKRKKVGGEDEAGDGVKKAVGLVQYDSD